MVDSVTWRRGTCRAASAPFAAARSISWNCRRIFPCGHRREGSGRCHGLCQHHPPAHPQRSLHAGFRRAYAPLAALGAAGRGAARRIAAGGCAAGVLDDDDLDGSGSDASVYDERRASEGDAVSAPLVRRGEHRPLDDGRSRHAVLAGGGPADAWRGASVQGPPPERRSSGLALRSAPAPDRRPDPAGPPLSTGWRKAPRTPWSSDPWCRGEGNQADVSNVAMSMTKRYFTSLFTIRS